MEALWPRLVWGRAFGPGFTGPRTPTVWNTVRSVRARNNQLRCHARYGCLGRSSKRQRCGPYQRGGKAHDEGLSRIEVAIGRRMMVGWMCGKVANNGVFEAQFFREPYFRARFCCRPCLWAECFCAWALPSKRPAIAEHAGAASHPLNSQSEIRPQSGSIIGPSGESRKRFARMALFWPSS